MDFKTVLRGLAEGRIRWAFWPPGTDPSIPGEAGDGIWISTDGDAAEHDLESDGEEEGVEQDRASESDEEGSERDDLLDEEEEEEGEEEESNEAGIGGRFGALALEGVSTEEE